uniref:Ig-like domain-containing protein n=1 Tax=Timema bartmani TaxID=61472 RepID=A0A7R9EQL6_9NEOP|nr:unnamed protein product [Timema bartmani]
MRKVLVIWWSRGQMQTTDLEPEFLAPLENLTVTQGRNVHFTCVVNHLGTYKYSMWAVCWTCLLNSTRPASVYILYSRKRQLIKL